MFATKLLAIVVSTKPVVPVGPVTVKLSTLLVELKASADKVEFDITEKTYWPLNEIIESAFDSSVDDKVLLPAQLAFTRYVPLAEGIQTAE